MCRLRTRLAGSWYADDVYYSGVVGTQSLEAGETYRYRFGATTADREYSTGEPTQYSDDRTLTIR